MIGEDPHQPLGLPLMLCQPLKLHRGIFVLIHIVLSARRGLNWDQKQGKCRVTIYIILIVSSLGLSSITLALFVVKNCHHKYQELDVVPQEVETEAAVPMGERTVGKVKEDGISSPIGGRFAHLAPALTRTEQLEAAHRQGKKTIAKWDIQDGHLTNTTISLDEFWMSLSSCPGPAWQITLEYLSLVKFMGLVRSSRYLYVFGV